MEVVCKIENKGEFTYKTFPVDQLKFKKNVKEEEVEEPVTDEIKNLIDWEKCRFSREKRGFILLSRTMKK